MGGIIHHLVAGIISGLIVYFIFKKKEYSIAIFTGNFLPDLVGAAYAAVMIRSISPATILHSAPWFSFDKSYIVQSFWIFTEVIFISLYLFFHVYLKKKRPHHEFEANLGFLLLGFVTHMMMDILIIEKGIWY